MQSKRGFSALTDQQRSILNANYKMIVTNVDMIEQVGGGSCRCMLVENWSTLDMSHLLPTNQNSHKIQKRIDYYFEKNEVMDLSLSNMSISSDDDSCKDNSSTISESFKINQISDDFNFFDDDKSMDNQVVQLDKYWDTHFSNPVEDLFGYGDILGEGKFHFKLQKKFPGSLDRKLR